MTVEIVGPHHSPSEEVRLLEHCIVRNVDPPAIDMDAVVPAVGACLPIQVL